MGIFEEITESLRKEEGKDEATVAIYGSRSVGKTSLARILTGAETSSFYYSYVKLRKADDSNATLHVYDIDKVLTTSDLSLLNEYSKNRLVVLMVNLTNPASAFAEISSMLNVKTQEKTLVVGSHSDKAKYNTENYKALLSALSQLCIKSGAQFVAVNLNAGQPLKKAIKYILGLSTEKPDILNEVNAYQSSAPGSWSVETQIATEAVDAFPEKVIDELVATRRAELATSRRIKTSYYCVVLIL